MSAVVGHAIRSAGRRALDVLTSRTVVVIATTCAILYAAFWVVALLQSNGLISTALPIPVADQVVLQRSGGQLRPAALSSAELAQRQRGLQSARQAPAAAGHAADPSSSLTLEIQSAPPVELWVTDGHGGEIGADPTTGLVRLNMPAASYSGIGSTPQLISIPHASGRYSVQLVGTANATYGLDVRLFRGTDVRHAITYHGTGQIFQDTVLETSATVGETPNQPPTLKLLPVQVVIAGKVPASSSPSPSPSSSPAGASASGSPSASPASANIVVPPVSVVRPVTRPRPLPASGVAPLAGGPPTVFRPRPVAKPPIPLPLPGLSSSSGGPPAS
ncbi:MAG: hypothetical protein ACYDAG_13420 [Chloroflexota bacterium]